MPNYEYELPNGKLVVAYRKFEDRDTLPEGCVRRNIGGASFVTAFNQNSRHVTGAPSVLKSLRDYECQVGTSELERKIGRKAGELKRIWQAPAPVGST